MNTNNNQSEINIKNLSVIEREKYKSNDNILRKWLAEYGKIDFPMQIVQVSKNMTALEQIFNLVYYVYANELESLVQERGLDVVEVDKYNNRYYVMTGIKGEPVRFSPTDTAFNLNEYLYQLGKIDENLYHGFNKPRKLRNSTHDTFTVIADAVLNNAKAEYGFLLEAVEILGQILIALGKMGAEYLKPTFEQLRVREGSTLEEFVVGRQIGEGGSSRVYESVYPSLQNAPVVIKEYKADAIPDFENYVNNEIGKLMQLKHPGIPNIYKCIKCNKTCYIVMEKIFGVSLDQFKRPLEVHEFLAIAKSLCETLNYIHSSGINHADIKPQNIMINDMNRVYLIDFGQGAFHNEKVNTSYSVGYGAPENEFGIFDEQAEVYSFGRVLAFLFNNCGYREQAPAVNEIIGKCLADRNNRYQSFRAVLHELNARLNGTGFYPQPMMGAVAKKKSKALVPVLVISSVLAVALIVVLIVVFSGNSGSGEKNQQAANPTGIYIPEATDTPTPTSTPTCTLAPTSTPTPTNEPTPTKHQLIITFQMDKDTIALNDNYKVEVYVGNTQQAILGAKESKTMVFDVKEGNYKVMIKKHDAKSELTEFTATDIVSVSGGDTVVNYQINRRTFSLELNRQ